MKCQRLLLAFALALAAPVTLAVTLGQRDTFDGSSTAGWVSGAASPVPPTVENGGPGGALDPYLLVRSLGGAAAGSRLVTFNEAQWAGDYVAAGVTGIDMDVRNFGSTDLQLYLLFESVRASPVIIATPGVLRAGGDWTQVYFDFGLAARAEALNEVVRLRLFHAGTGAFPPDAVTATLGVDNIRAVPLPPTALLSLGAIAALLPRVRLRRPARRGEQA